MSKNKLWHKEINFCILGELWLISCEKKKKKKPITYYNERIMDVPSCKTDSYPVPSLSASQEVHSDRRVIDDRRVTPTDTCGTEDEPNMWFRSSVEPPAVRK